MLEHVIVGVLLLTPLLFLMPTVLAFYAFWLAVFLTLKVLETKHKCITPPARRETHSHCFD